MYKSAEVIGVLPLKALITTEADKLRQHHDFFFFFSEKIRFDNFCQMIHMKWQVLFSLKGVFVCVEVLRPSQPNGVMSSAVSLPNHTFTGQA